jgi:glyoxylase-like metal-dependent hydrolase (beta-lactamase superfamily II)
MWKSEWEHWIEEATKAENPNGPARRNLLPIKDKVTLIDSEREIVPGVCAVHAPGHTMGHMAVLVESKDEKLLHTVDAVHHPVQLLHPDWAPSFDVNPEVSTATRRKLFEQAANEKMLMLAYHFAFPGLGYVEKVGDAFKWNPISA